MLLLGYNFSVVGLMTTKGLRTSLNLYYLKIVSCWVIGILRSYSLTFKFQVPSRGKI